jgi:transposase
MHITLLASEGLSPTEIARVLFCSRTTVYAVVSRFLREGRAAFDERKGRGPVPLLDKETDERIEELLEEDSPVEHGWLRSRWSCKLLCLQLRRERLASARHFAARCTGWSTAGGGRAPSGPRKAPRSKSSASTRGSKTSCK